MKVSSQSGFSHLLVLVLLVVLVIGGVGYSVYSTQQSKKADVQQTGTDQAADNGSTAEPERPVETKAVTIQASLDTTNWQTYTHANPKISFKYPAGWNDVYTSEIGAPGSGMEHRFDISLANDKSKIEQGNSLPGREYVFIYIALKGDPYGDRSEGKITKTVSADTDLTEYMQANENVSLHLKETSTIGGAPAIRYKFSRSQDKNAELDQYSKWYVKVGDSICVIDWGKTTEDGFTRAEPAYLNTLLSTIRF
jgi:hypothetical protein